jgi:hypothetical protein
MIALLSVMGGFTTGILSIVECILAVSATGVLFLSLLHPIK